MNGLAWTRATPAEPGVYWLRRRDPFRTVIPVRLVMVDWASQESSLGVVGTPHPLTDYVELYAPCLWCGPIAEPPPIPADLP